MEEKHLNIVKLIENNPITILSNDYNVKLLTKIKENQYNIDNYNLLLKKNEDMQEEIYKLQDKINEQTKIIKNSNKKINKLEYDITDNNKTKISSNFALCKYGYFLYAYQYENMRFICSITRQKDFDIILKNLKDLYPTGKIIYQFKCSYPLTERNMTFLLKQNCISLGQQKYETSIENIQKIIQSVIKLEELLSEHGKDIDLLLDILSNNLTINVNEEINPNVPIVRKPKRSIDKINKETGEVIETFESIEAARRSCGLITGLAIAYAVRESRLCQGFLWRYSGVSKEEQFTKQPVVKICCKNGEKQFFKNISDGAKDVNISALALRHRILNDIHVNNYHWIFDTNTTHYT